MSLQCHMPAPWFFNSTSENERRKDRSAEKIVLLNTLSKCSSWMLDTWLVPKRLYGNNELDDDGDGGDDRDDAERACDKTDDGDGGDDRDDAERAGERADVTTDQCGPTDGARVSRKCPCGCPSCIGYNSVLPNPFPTPYMSARTSTLGRWSTRQRQRPALPEAELGWQIESTCLTLAPTSPVSAHGFRAAPPPRSDPSLTPARQVRHQWRRTPSPSDLVETTRPSRHSREPPTQGEQQSWVSRQRQRPALPEAELGWQIQEK